MIFSKSELHRRGSDMLRKGWTSRFYHDFLDSVWRDPFINRTSGFDVAGGPDSEITFNEGSRKFSITPKETRFSFWQFIVRIAFFKRYEGFEITLPNESGLYLIYIFRDEEDQTHRQQKLFYIKDPDIDDIREVYLNRVIVAWVYWNEILEKALYFGDSRHGSEWNPQMHWMLHQTINSQRQEGISITGATYDGDGTLESDYLLGITSGKVWHDDILKNVNAVSTSQALPVWYIAAGGHPTYNTSIHKKFITTGTGRVAYNPPTGGIAEAVSNHFVVYHLFATNCLLFPHISAMGQASHESLGAATGSIEAEIATLRQQLPHANMMHVGSFILQTSDDYTNDAKARIVYISNNTDTFVSEMIWDEQTKTLTLKRTNGMENLTQILSGIDGNDGREVELQKTTTHVQWRYVGDTVWNDLIPLTDIKGNQGDSGADGNDGREIELQKTTTHVQWRYVGDTVWNDLIALIDIKGDQGDPGADGNDGREIELRNSGTYIQWRYVGTYVWYNLIEVSTLKGDQGDPGTDGTDGTDGREIELQNSGTYIQWRYVGETTWINLIALSALKGDQGDPGTDGTNGTDGADGDSAYIYIAYASDDQGADFTTTFDPDLDYIAVLTTTTEITNPDATDFNGLWKKYKGEDGEGIDFPSFDEFYLGDPVNFGPLYNHFAATDPRNIANEGWRLPTRYDFKDLLKYIEPAATAIANTVATKLRDDQQGWDILNGTNDYGFNARGAGARSYSTGLFSDLKDSTKYWDDLVFGGINGGVSTINNATDIFQTYDGNQFYTLRRQAGASIRLVAESTTKSHGETGEYLGNDGKRYKTICIGNQEWLAENLAETKFRNGDWIHGFDNGVYTPISDQDWVNLTSDGMCFWGNDESNSGGKTFLKDYLEKFCSSGNSENWHWGTSNPTSEIGTNGDLYINTTTWDIFEKNNSGSWVLLGNIKGADGQDGEDGEPGAPGSDGATWHSGSGTPSSQTGSIGDFYYQTDTGDIYEKTDSTTWTIISNITGPPGPAGGGEGEDYVYLTGNFQLSSQNDYWVDALIGDSNTIAARIEISLDHGIPSIQHTAGYFTGIILGGNVHTQNWEQIYHYKNAAATQITTAPNVILFDYGTQVRMQILFPDLLPATYHYKISVTFVHKGP